MRAATIAVIMLACTIPAAAREDAAAIAERILDDSLPAQQRQSLIEQHPELAAELVAAMTKSLPAEDAAEEYRRIPWIWRVAVAAGKHNYEKAIRGLLEVSLPQKGQKLRDWQAVVIGGGVINGISLTGKWPQPRIGELLAGSEALEKRWQQALSAAAAMADDVHVKKGTRYDALRMIALDPTEKARQQLTRYLAAGTDAELQMGAVSGLSDIDLPDVAPILIDSLQHLTAKNRSLAVDALLRTGARKKALRAALEKGTIAAEWLSAEQKKSLHSP